MFDLLQKNEPTANIVNFINIYSHIRINVHVVRDQTEANWLRVFCRFWVILIMIYACGILRKIMNEYVSLYVQFHNGRSIQQSIIIPNSP